MSTISTYIEAIEKSKSKSLKDLSEAVINLLLFLKDSSQEQFLEYYDKYYGLHPIIDRSFEDVKEFKGYSNYVGCWFYKDSNDINTLWFLHWIFANPVRPCVSCEGYSNMIIETVEKTMNLNNQSLKTLPKDLLDFLDTSKNIFKPVGGGGYQMVGDTSFKSAHTKPSSYLYDELLKGLYKNFGLGVLTIKTITPDNPINQIKNETLNPNAEKRTISLTKTGEYITPRFKKLTNVVLKPKPLEF